MASVSADDIRDVINVTSEEIPDEKVSKMIKRAQVTVELETDQTVDSNNCSDAEKEAITLPKQARLHRHHRRRRQPKTGEDTQNSWFPDTD